MEINITRFFETEEAADYSASRAELGDNAGKITWNNAMGEAVARPLLATEEQLDALRRWAKSSGGWDEDEISAWSDDECNALFIQIISGDMRELESLCMSDDGEIDWDEAERLSSEGTIRGCLYPGADGEIYYDLD